MAEGSRGSSEAIRIGVEEAGILQGFRADYPWHGSRSRRFIQIGNAVCPPLACLVVEAISRHSLGQKERKR
jgi:DNA (cytosine-5)-methyltransferase 1